MIHVCSLARLNETVEDTGARHVVSLLTATRQPSSGRPAISAGKSPVAAAARHRRTARRLHRARRSSCRQPVELRAPLGSPRAAGRALPHGHQPLDRECYSRRCARSIRIAPKGVSHRRCAPPRRPRRPSIRMVSFADRLLGRGGRMVAAVETIGRGAFIERRSDAVPARAGISRAAITLPRSLLRGPQLGDGGRRHRRRSRGLDARRAARGDCAARNRNRAKLETRSEPRKLSVA